MKWFDDDLEEKFEHMRQHLERTLASLSRPGAATTCGDINWRPSLDLYETSEEFTVLVDLAGIQPQELDVVVERQAVRIAGNRCRPSVQGIIRVHHMEIDFGPFSYALKLSAPVDPSGSSSSYRDGFLTIHLPKLTRGSRTVAVTSED